MSVDATVQWRLFMVDVVTFTGRILRTSGPYSQAHAQRVADDIGVTDEAYPDIRRATEREIAIATDLAMDELARNNGDGR